MKLNRREFVKWMAASTGAAAVVGCAGMGGTSAGRVVVIGGGYGGATAARYIRLWAPDVDVTLVERNDTFVSCPISNLVLGGNTQMGNITMGYEGLRARGVRLVRDVAQLPDPADHGADAARTQPPELAEIPVVLLDAGRPVPAVVDRVHRVPSRDERDGRHHLRRSDRQ